MRLAVSAGLLLLAACGQSGDKAAQRIALDEISGQVPEPLPSPDVTGAIWREQTDGSLNFGKAGEVPLLTLACSARTARILRHTPAEPGAKALFALIGNGRIARIMADESEGEWISVLAASDGGLQVFAGSGPVDATLPGAGTLSLAGSPLPGQLLARCRRPAPQDR